MAKPLQQSKFYAISREIREAVKGGYFSSDTTAFNQGVSVTTVNAIRRYKTWAAYQANLLARHQSRKVTPAEKQLSEDLANLEAAPSRKEFDDAMQEVNSRFRAHWKAIEARELKGKRRPFFGRRG